LSAHEEQHTPARQAVTAEQRGEDAFDFTELWRPEDADVAYRSPERILLEHGRITQEQLDAATELQRANPRLSVLDALVESGAIDEIVALQAVADYFNLPFARLNPGDVDPEVYNLLPSEYVKDKSVVPIRRDGERIVLGIADPADIFLIDDVKRRVQAELDLAVTPSCDIARVVEDFSTNPQNQVEDIIQDIAEDTVEVVGKQQEEVTDLEKIAGESPVIRYVNYLIFQAVK